MTLEIRWSSSGPMESETVRAIVRAHHAIEEAIDVRFRQGGYDISYRESDYWGTSAATTGMPSTVWLLPGEQGRNALHETGHSLGLPHPHEVGMAELGMTDTMMAYKYDAWSPAVGAWLVPQSLMRWDVEQLVTIYGRSHVNDGDTVHRPDPHILSSVIDWQGVDTIDLGRSAGATIDLGSGWIHHGNGDGRTWVMDGIERVILSPGADRVVLSAGDMFIGLGRNDRLVSDDHEADKLSAAEKRELGLTGRWFDVGGAVIAWKGSGGALEALIVES